MKTEIAESLYKIYNKGYKTWKTLKYGTDMFYTVVLETTTLCTRKCSYCPNSLYDRGIHEMPVELFEKIMKELKEMGWSGMIRPFLYGDPLADKRLPELMKIARKYLPKSNIIIYTNGDLLTDELYDKLIPHVNGFFITDHGNLNSNLPKRSRIIVRKLGKLCDRGGLVKIEDKLLIDKVKKCMGATEILTIYWDGSVILCCQDYFGKISFGNLKKESIIDIWKKPEFVNLRKMLRDGIPSFEICRHCIEVPTDNVIL